MGKSLQNNIFLFIILFILGFFVFGTTESLAASLAPQFGKAELSLNVGDRVSVPVLNGDDVAVWSNTNAAEATVTSPKSVLIVGLKPGEAKVTACSRVVYCTYLRVMVSGKNTPNPRLVTAVLRSAPPKAPVSKPIVLKPAVIKSAAPKPRTVLKSAVVFGPKKNASVPELKKLALSQTKVTVEKRASVDVFVAGGNGITAVSDSPVARTAVNDNRITIYGTQPGSATVTVCDANLTCGTIAVKVAPATSGVFTVSPQGVTLYSGESSWINTSNGSNLSVISSNRFLVNATVKNDLIFITAFSSYYTGNATLKVCSGQLQNQCALVRVTVVKKPVPPRASGSFKSVTVEEGQSIEIPYPNSYALSYRVLGGVGDPAITPAASITVNSNSFTVYGKSYGTAVFELCPVPRDSACGTVGVSVVTRSSCGANAGVLRVSETGVVIERGGTAYITASNCTGLAALSSDAEVVGIGVSGNSISLHAKHEGEITVKVCDATGVCVPVTVTVVSKK